jgi:hypothetical protein
MICNGARELYLAKSPVKNWFPQRRNARQTFADQLEPTETSGQQKSKTEILQKSRRILPTVVLCVMSSNLS